MAERNDGGAAQFVIAGGLGQGGHDAIKVLPRPLVEVKGGVEVGHHPELGEAETRERVAHGGMLEDALLDHVVVGHHETAHERAVFRNPQVGARLAVGHGPLPDGGSQGRGEHGEKHHGGEERFHHVDEGATRSRGLRGRPSAGRGRRVRRDCSRRF